MGLRPVGAWASTTAVRNPRCTADTVVKSTQTDVTSPAVSRKRLPVRRRWASSSAVWKPSKACLTTTASPGCSCAKGGVATPGVPPTQGMRRRSLYAAIQSDVSARNGARRWTTSMPSARQKASRRPTADGRAGNPVAIASGQKSRWASISRKTKGRQSRAVRGSVVVACMAHTSGSECASRARRLAAGQPPGRSGVRPRCGGAPRHRRSVADEPPLRPSLGGQVVADGVYSASGPDPPKLRGRKWLMSGEGR